jgi:hypothetical protein
MLRRSRHAAVLVLAVVAALCAGPIAAQPAADEALRAARDLMSVMRTTDQVKQMLPSIMQLLKPAIVQGRPEVERDFEKVMPILLEGFNERLSGLVDAMALVYARNFSPDEMRQMMTFYRSLVGQKVLEKMPVVMQESMSVGQAFGQRVGAELRTRMIDELRKRGHTI